MGPSMMNALGGDQERRKTAKGFMICRRCDDCGMKISLKADYGEQCILTCSACGKEYRFFCRTANS